MLVLGSCPVFCLVCCLSDDTQIWPGDLRVVFGCGFVFVVLFIGFAVLHMTSVLCAEFYFTDASSHVRTEPFERHRPNRRKQKKKCKEKSSPRGENQNQARELISKNESNEASRKHNLRTIKIARFAASDFGDNRISFSLSRWCQKKRKDSL